MVCPEENITPHTRLAQCGILSGLLGKLWLLLLPAGLVAEQLRFDTQQEWQRWKLPLGAVELSAEGIIQPVRVRKNINAVLDAKAFGGGIRGAGANQIDAGLVMDGDLSTGWSPNWNDPVEDWWIEIDLGRAVSAHQVRLIFAEEAPPFELFDLLVSNGEQVRDNARVLVPGGTLVYQIKERFSETKRHRMSLALGRPEQSLVQGLRVQLLRSPPGARLVEVEVEAFGDNLILGALKRGGNVDIVMDLDDSARESVSLGNALSLMDGNLNTYWGQSGNLGGEKDILSHILLDLGAVYWVDQVRLISLVANARWLAERIRQEGWRELINFFWGFNFYEVLTSDGSLGPGGTLRWDKRFSGWVSTLSHQQELADHHFEPALVRYVRVLWKSWDSRERREARGLTEEIMVFGEGYPREARLRSPLLDLGADKNIDLLRWQAHTPPGTRLEVRSRTGNDLEPQITYHDKNGKEVTQKRWEKLIPNLRGSVDTSFVVGKDWSPWSRSYLLSGEEFQSPSPRRYLELEARLISDTPDAAASLDWLAVEFSEPLAQEVVGEIYPVEAKPGVEQEFSYFLKAPATAGFDRLIEASTPLRFVDAALDDVDAVAEVQPNGKGFQVRFPRAIREGELVEVRFDAAIFLHATRFEIFLEDSRQNVRQRVDPGDATGQVESSTDVVRLPLGSELLANLSLSSKVLTPNGDGINDELRVGFALVNMLAGRPLRLQLFDLSGRLVWEEEKVGLAGVQEFAWDGRDAGGSLVPSGMYILRLKVKGDARTEIESRLISVVY